MLISKWDQVLTEESTHETTSKLVAWHLGNIGDKTTRDDLNDRTSRAGCLRQLCEFPIAYDKLTSNDAYHVRQILAFFQKRKDLEFGVDVRQVALDKFIETEQQCSVTNSIFKHWASGGFRFPTDVEAIFHRSQRIIATVLGDVPSLECLNLGFGPGATTQIKRKISSPRSKLGQMFCCSEDLTSLLPELLGEMPAWIPFQEDSESALVDVAIQPCRLGFVPKNAKTDRAICTEPSLNVMLQKGIGQYMTQRLSHFGVDLLDQSKNKNLAREGSITGELATLDLSSASDLIATELVYHLLPVDWFVFLSCARSGHCEINGSTVRLQKFSSMGNGFTFPLESLIFYAISRACCGKDEVVSVYGDDIIIPTARHAVVMKALVAAGFLINTEKSFVEGPFRESCGGDYYSGVDIRPYYLKDRLSGMTLFSLYNYYTRRGLSDPASIVLSCIPDHLRLYGPDGYGDGHLIGDHPRVRPKSQRERGWEGYTFDTYTLRPLKDFTVHKGDNVLPCYSIYASGPLFEEFFRIDPWGDRPDNFPSYRSVTAFYRKSVLGVSIPGYKGYKKISIYCLGR